MESRISAVENAISGIQVGITEFQNRLEVMLVKVDNNDKEMKNVVDGNDLALKAALEGKFQALEKGYTEMCKTLRDEINTTIGNAVAKIGEEMRNKLDQASAEHITLLAEHKGLETQVMGLESSRIKPMEDQVLAVSATLATDRAEFKKGIDDFKMKLDYAKSTGTVGDVSDWNSNKPIMEYKAVAELDKLTNDKTGFRDWKVRMKDAFTSSLKTTSFLQIRDWAEDPATILTGMESIQDIMRRANEEYGIPTHIETYERVGTAIKPMLTQKSGDKTEEFLVTKRSETGWSAWNKGHRYYMATSGHGI